MHSLLDSKADATTAATRNFPRFLQPNGQQMQRPNRLHSYQLPSAPGHGKVCAPAETENNEACGSAGERVEIGLKVCVPGVSSDVYFVET